MRQTWETPWLNVLDTLPVLDVNQQTPNFKSQI
jgi:hypothetical protein